MGEKDGEKKKDKDKDGVKKEKKEKKDKDKKEKKEKSAAKVDGGGEKPKKDKEKKKEKKEKKNASTVGTAKTGHTDEGESEEAAFWAELDDEDPLVAPQPSELPVQATPAAPTAANAATKAPADTTSAAALQPSIVSSHPLAAPPPPQELDPLAPRSYKLSLSEAKLLHDEGRRWLARVQGVAPDVIIDMPEPDGSASTVEARVEGDDASAIQRGDLCLRGALASLQGEYLEFNTLPEDDQTTSVFLDIPALAGVAIHPQTLMETFEVVAFIAREKDAQDHSLASLKSKDAATLSRQLGFSVGQAIEARYEDNWFLGEVTGFTESQEIVVQWQGGGEAAVSASAVRASSLRPASANYSKKALDGKPGGRMLIFGLRRARVAALLHSMAAVERVIPGEFSERHPPAESTALFEFGIKLVALAGADAAAMVSKHRARIAAASEAIVEVLGRRAALAGEPEERGRAEQIVLHVVPAMGPYGDVPGRPEGVDDCLSCVRVPTVAASQMTGSELENIQDETGTLVLWLPSDTARPLEGVPGVALVGILGQERNRRASALRLMAASERACPGVWSRSAAKCLKELRGGAKEVDVIFGTEATPVADSDAELEWARSPQGQQALRRAAAAAGCVMEHVGPMAIQVGLPDERELCKEYARWTIKARMPASARGEAAEDLSVLDADMRDDITILVLPEARASILRPDRLWPIESETSTLALFDDGGGSALPPNTRRLLICGQLASARERAKWKVQAIGALAAAGDKAFAKHLRADDATNGRDSNKKPRLAQGDSGAGGGGTSKKSNPKEVLATMAWPTSINQWGTLQNKIWDGHPKLPKGWIRVWSKSQDSEYYLRLKDMKSTFTFSEVVAAPDA